MTPAPSWPTVEPSPSRAGKAYEQISDQIRHWILDGTLTIGDRLPGEVELSQRFQTSRNTVREALRYLSSEGLIVTRPGAKGGSTVAQMDPLKVSDAVSTAVTLMLRADDINAQDIYDARLMIEVPAAGQAARNRLPEHLDAMVSCLGDPPTSLGVIDLTETNRMFHLALLNATGNRVLPLLMAPALHFTRRLESKDRTTEEGSRLIIEHHRTIYEAVRCGDADAAASAMQDHLAAGIRSTQDMCGGDG